MSTYLTKSDFKVASTCPTKLYYKKLRYPSLLDDDPYLEFLADGGYMVEKMAKLLFPGGREIGDWDRPEQAFEQTREALESGDGTLFEATVIHGNLLARVDILRREGNTLSLIEVKSSAVDSVADGPSPFHGKRGGIPSQWRPYIEDVAFQAVVLRRVFSGFMIVPILCVVDKAKTASDNVTFAKFYVQRGQGLQGRFRPEVQYSGDVNRLSSDHILALLDVSTEVSELETEVAGMADALALTLQNDPISCVRPEIGLRCKKCEYRLPHQANQQSGFRECWGILADPDPHVLDLYRIDLVGGKNSDVVASLAARGKARLSDISSDLLSGAAADRQRLQLYCTARGAEHIDPKLTEILSEYPYPLHFIDFEGSRLALPYHAGMRPYEQAAFQWSCHTIRMPGGSIEHSEWLNSAEAFPNFDFARGLQAQIGRDGTVFVWSHYELDVLREIRRQMDLYGERDTPLAEWLDHMTVPHGGRVVDLCDLAKAYYFHPTMKGSLSIKYVLPAVWQSDAALRTHPAFAKYLKLDPAGQPQNPYDALPPLPIGESEEVVNEGTGAMRVYQEMMFGLAGADPALQESYRRLLLQYCELDTAAMVMIWKHWSKT
jgi:hypothetical protein